MSKIEKVIKDLCEEIPDKLIGIKKLRCDLLYKLSYLVYVLYKRISKQIQDSKSNPNTFLRSMFDSFQSLKQFKKQTGTISITPFIKQFMSLNEIFNNDYLHDVHEFLIWVLSALDENLKSKALLGLKMSFLKNL